MAERFHRDVVEDFVAEYAAGRTPNPCLRCNEKIKFAAVLDRALALGFDAVCTGHYARIVDGVLHRAADPGKDQSYVLAVLTSDNPRSEDPRAIIAEALAGAAGADNLTVEEDRTRAIAMALGGAAPGDVVVIAGKGHETGQTIGEQTLPFDDRAVARRLLGEVVRPW